MTVTGPIALRDPVEVAPRRGLLGRSWTRSAGLVLCVVGVGVMVVASIAIGAKSIAPGTVLDAIFAFDASIDDHLIVRELRLPRTAIALVVGAALGLAGGVMQGVTRNPLADPGLLGVNAGASVAVVLGIDVLDVTAPLGYVWFAFGGAAFAGFVVYVLGAMGRGGATPVKLAIAGAAISALLGSITAALLILDAATLDQFRFWSVGSTAGRDVDLTVPLLPFLAVGALLALLSGRALNGLALGEDVARSLGQRVGWVQAVAALSVVLLCGGATAAAGPIAFVGLTVPHVARAVTGPDHRWLLPYSMFLGAILLVAADVVGRIIARPGELEVGIVTAFLGAPVFIAFVRRRKIAEL